MLDQSSSVGRGRSGSVGVGRGRSESVGVGRGRSGSVGVGRGRSGSVGVGLYLHVAVHRDCDHSKEEQEGVPHAAGRTPLEGVVTRALETVLQDNGVHTCHTKLVWTFTYVLNILSPHLL